MSYYDSLSKIEPSEDEIADYKAQLLLRLQQQFPDVNNFDKKIATSTEFQELNHFVHATYKSLSRRTSFNILFIKIITPETDQKTFAIKIALKPFYEALPTGEENEFTTQLDEITSITQQFSKHEAVKVGNESLLRDLHTLVAINIGQKLTEIISVKIADTVSVSIDCHLLVKSFGVGKRETESKQSSPTKVPEIVIGEVQKKETIGQYLEKRKQIRDSKPVNPILAFIVGISGFALIGYFWYSVFKALYDWIILRESLTNIELVLFVIVGFLLLYRIVKKVSKKSK